MGIKTDLLGQTFGALTVIKETDERDHNGRICWLCRCTCGKEKVISSKDLIGGSTKSCGDGHYASETRTEKVGDKSVKDKTICLSGGADCLHSGHIAMIKDAMAYGKVIWILNSDEWLRRKKGYCFMEYDERETILRAINGIYDVVPVDDLNGGTVCEALRRIKPDFFGNGGDRTDQNTPERSLCEEIGIELVWGLGGTKTQSSSELIDSVVDCIIKKLTRW